MKPQKLKSRIKLRAWWDTREVSTSRPRVLSWKLSSSDKTNIELQQSLKKKETGL